MRDELKQLRKTSAMKPVSKMKKTDIALELEKLRGVRGSTPPVDATKATPMKMMEGKISDVKVAKEREFPVAPASAKKGGEKKAGEKKGKVGEKKVKVIAGEGGMVEAKMSKKDILKKLIEELGED